MKKFLILLTVTLYSLMNPLFALAQDTDSVFDLSHEISSAVYEASQAQEWIQAEVIEEELGEPDEVKEIQDGVATQWIYQLEDDEYEIELILVYVEAYEGFAESLANVELKDPQSGQLDLSLFRAIGQELKNTYFEQEFLSYQEAAELLPAHSSISLVHDLIIYHYDGETSEEAYTLTTLEDDVISFHYQDPSKNSPDAVLDVDPADLDLIHHRSESRLNNVTHLIGTPAAINYDLINGMTTYGWFSSQAEDGEATAEEVVGEGEEGEDEDEGAEDGEGRVEGVREVYFHEDFYGAMIALSYQ